MVQEFFGEIFRTLKPSKNLITRSIRPLKLYKWQMRCRDGLKMRLHISANIVTFYFANRMKLDELIPSWMV